MKPAMYFLLALPVITLTALVASAASSDIYSTENNRDLYSTEESRRGVYTTEGANAIYKTEDSRVGVYTTQEKGPEIQKPELVPGSDLPWRAKPAKK